ncbi:sigma-70 family RNA polymerase sigma factor [Nocardioides terrigena]|uniref:sigma-70 family RNA polymerase sigma factor n=1 Tax=Nocardioides terrigena TaxID=424797 RepID=UPI000D317E83|nr:sigma-70 family RNA polymerase sigma factor [Nocardioides terrigena]
MTDDEALAGRFERVRPRLHAVAVRMLGTHAAADDAVQEAWLRLHRSEPDGIDNLDGWLTTVVSRICLDTLKSGSTRREHPVGEVPEVVDAHEPDPADQAVTADAVGAALLVVLDQLGPNERLAFVLHDLFGVPFDQVAPIVDTSPGNARQLASRARRKVRGGESEPDRRRQREVVDAFLEAAREGRFERLLTMLDPDIELRADAFSVSAAATRRHLGAPVLDPVMHGREAVAEVFSGRAAAAQAAYVDGLPAAVWAPGGTTRSAWVLTIADGVITRVEMLGDPATLAGLEVELL